MLRKFWVICMGLVLPAVAKAATVDFGTSYGSNLGLGTQDVRVTVARIIHVALGILGMLMVVLIIYGVIGAANGYGTSRFDTSKRIIGGAFIGLLIIVVAYALTNWVFSVILGAT